MYDVDGNGVIDQDEMSKIIQVKSVEGFSLNYLNLLNLINEGHLRHAGPGLSQAG